MLYSTCRDIAQAVINDADSSRIDDEVQESISYRTARSPSPVQRSPRPSSRVRYNLIIMLLLDIQYDSIINIVLLIIVSSLMKGKDNSGF